MITSEIISQNLNLLETAKKYFPLLSKYESCIDTDTIDFNEKSKISLECVAFNLKQYTDFIDFIIQSKKNGQEVFYRKKITNKELQNIMVNCASDKDAKNTFKSKGPKSLQMLLDSDSKYEVLSAQCSNYRRKRRRYVDNFLFSQAIVSNFVIQNDLDLKYPHRISKYYRILLSPIDRSIKSEIDKTKEVITFVVDQLSKSGLDFKKLNYSHLTKSLNDEIRNRILTIENGEKIKCIDISGDCDGLTMEKVYDVIGKEMESSLYVRIMNDYGNSSLYSYRLFETISNLRDSALNKILKDI